jgi:hypothetical protein
MPLHRIDQVGNGEFLQNDHRRRPGCAADQLAQAADIAERRRHHLRRPSARRRLTQRETFGNARKYMKSNQNTFWRTGCSTGQKLNPRLFRRLAVRAGAHLRDAVDQPDAVLEVARRCQAQRSRAQRGGDLCRAPILWIGDDGG